jgi:imidazolonepropionase
METEIKMLRVARRIERVRPIRVKTTFLGAHAIPPEYRGDAPAYIDDVCLPTLEAAHEEGLVDAVDAFCEAIAFSSAELEPVFAKAKAVGLPVKIHAEQLSHCGGTELAARYDALSADHVEYATKEDASKMAKAGVAAVLLPGAFYTLGETQKPPVEAFRESSVPMAIATDYNPGSSPLSSLLLAMNMACTLFGVTPQEALGGTTRQAAKALGLTDVGVIRSSMVADLAIWDVNHPAELSYRIGHNPLHKRVFGGV